MRIFLLLFISVSIYAQSIELNLKQFAELVSFQHRINIVIDDNIKKDSFSFYVQKDNNTIMLAVFKKMLSLKKLKLIFDKRNNFYYIEKVIVNKPKVEKKIFRSIVLKSLQLSDIELFLKSIEGLNYSYLSNTNTILLQSTKKEFENISNFIKFNDVVPSQFQIKITVVETNLNVAKDRGLEISAYSQSLKPGGIQYFLDLVTLPYTASKNIFNNSTFGITAALKFLDTNGISKIKSSPLMTVQSGKKIYFASVENIPFLDSSTTVSGASQSKSQNITYKDVGLKIDLTPKRINDIVFIDLTLIMESVVGSSSLTPITAKRELRNSFHLKKGELLVLSGIVQSDSSTSSIGIPILMKMPYLGQMFRIDRDVKTEKSLSILIELM